MNWREGNKKKMKTSWMKWNEIFLSSPTGGTMKVSCRCSRTPPAAPPSDGSGSVWADSSSTLLPIGLQPDIWLWCFHETLHNDRRTDRRWTIDTFVLFILLRGIQGHSTNTESLSFYRQKEVIKLFPSTRSIISLWLRRPIPHFPQSVFPIFYFTSS